MRREVWCCLQRPPRPPPLLLHLLRGGQRRGGVIDRVPQRLGAAAAAAAARGRHQQRGHRHKAARGKGCQARKAARTGSRCARRRDGEGWARLRAERPHATCGDGGTTSTGQPLPAHRSRPPAPASAVGRWAASPLPPLERAQANGPVVGAKSPLLGLAARPAGVPGGPWRCPRRCLGVVGGPAGPLRRVQAGVEEVESAPPQHRPVHGQATRVEGPARNGGQAQARQPLETPRAGREREMRG